MTDGKVRHNVDWLSHIGAAALSQLNHSVDLYAVLRGHLWLEQDVVNLLRLGAADAGREAGFKKRITRAQIEGLIDHRDFAFLSTLNRIRNGFAHELEREELNQVDDDALFEAADETIRILYARLTVEVEEPESHRPVGLRFRGLLAAMHVHLLQLIAEKERQS